MVEFHTSPAAKLAAEIIAALQPAIGVAAAARWMLAACPALGDDDYPCSPAMALREGREIEVWRVARAILGGAGGADSEWPRGN